MGVVTQVEDYDVVIGASLSKHVENIGHIFEGIALRKLSHFISYVNTKGLGPKDQFVLKCMMPEVFARTSQHWEPGNCLRFSRNAFAYAILESDHPWALPIPQNYQLLWVACAFHEWLEIAPTGLSLIGPDNIIFDPIGLDFLPHFGLPSVAPDNLHETYRSQDIFVRSHIDPSILFEYKHKSNGYHEASRKVEDTRFTVDELDNPEVPYSIVINRRWLRKAFPNYITE